jgi:hypothetical protein
MDQPRAIAEAVLKQVQTQVLTFLNGKNYLVDQKAFMAHLRSHALLETAKKACVVAVLTTINSEPVYTSLVPRQNRILPRCGKSSHTSPSGSSSSSSLVYSLVLGWCFSFGRAVSYETVTRCLEHLCLRMMHPRIVGSARHVSLSLRCFK